MRNGRSYTLWLCAGTTCRTWPTAVGTRFVRPFSTRPKWTEVLTSGTSCTSRVVQCSAYRYLASSPAVAREGRPWNKPASRYYCFGRTVPFAHRAVNSRRTFAVNADSNSALLKVVAKSPDIATWLLLTDYRNTSSPHPIVLYHCPPLRCTI